MVDLNTTGSIERRSSGPQKVVTLSGLPAELRVAYVSCGIRRRSYSRQGCQAEYKSDLLLSIEGDIGFGPT